MRTALLGGTFDPVHIGHLLMADEVLARCDYQRVVFVPNRVPPHKENGPLATPEQRLEMLELATAERAEFGVHPYEIEQEGVSYTVRTLEHLVSSGSVTGNPGLIIGEDLVAGFSGWKDADRVEKMADLILVRRPGNRKTGFARRHTELNNVMLDISSTEIRQRVSGNLPFRYLVHPGVFEYICRHRLYR